MMIPPRISNNERAGRGRGAGDVGTMGGIVLMRKQVDACRDNEPKMIKGSKSQVFFRFHLTTLILLSLVAAELLWANTIDQFDGYGWICEDAQLFKLRKPTYVDQDTEWHSWGWPISFYEIRKSSLAKEVFLLKPRLAVNLGCNALLLFLVGFLSEVFLRRQSRRGVLVQRMR